jgi:hypothetical protein
VLTVESTALAIVSGPMSPTVFYTQRTPLQMSHETSSILDLIRPGGGLIVVKLDRMDGTRGDVLNLVHELEEKGASLRGLEPAFETGRPRAAWS